MKNITMSTVCLAFSFLFLSVIIGSWFINPNHECPPPNRVELADEKSAQEYYVSSTTGYGATIGLAIDNTGLEFMRASLPADIVVNIGDRVLVVPCPDCWQGISNACVINIVIRKISD